MGTPAYVSPEQAAGEAPTAASDWYSVGVMLYEALAGRRPFVGSSTEVLTRKLSEDPPPPSRWARGIPPDLDDLCVDLMKQAPAGRPDGAEILRRLGAIGSKVRRPSMQARAKHRAGARGPRRTGPRAPRGLRSRSRRPDGDRARRRRHRNGQVLPRRAFPRGPPDERRSGDALRPRIRARIGPLQGGGQPHGCAHEAARPYRGGRGTTPHSTAHLSARKAVSRHQARPEPGSPSRRSGGGRSPRPAAGLRRSA